MAMNAMFKTKAAEREEVEALLPWHAAGTLSRREADMVERALADDAELAAQYQTVREDLAETIVANESLGAPSAPARKNCAPIWRVRPVPTRRCPCTTRNWPQRKRIRPDPRCRAT